MALYLSMDGIDDRIVTPSLVYNKVVFDVYVTPPSATVYLLDPTVRTDSGYIRVLTSSFAANLGTLTGQAFSTRTTITLTLPAVKTSSLSLFGAMTGGSFLSGKLYDVKFYNDATIVAHYDMTTGNVQDTSGNGKHATLTGGTWLDDGAGGGTTPTDATVAGIIANALADTIAPAVSTVSSVSTSIATISATLTADTFNPTLSVSSQISSPFGTSTADILSPSVGSFMSITVNAVIVSATAEAVNPSVDADRSIGIDTLIADATADALAAMVGSSASVQITATVTSVTADGITPTISTTQGVRVDSVAAELTIDAISPEIQADAIISAFIADVIATGMAPIINRDAIPQYREVIQIVLNITRKHSDVLNITRKQTSALDITQRMQSELNL